MTATRDRLAAFRVLRQDVAESIGRGRFSREIRLAGGGCGPACRGVQRMSASGPTPQPECA
jgi:hypothetical protein